MRNLFFKYKHFGTDIGLFNFLELLGAPLKAPFNII